MKVNENNFIDLIRKGREEGILYVIDTYGTLLHTIVRKRLFMEPERIEACMNNIFLGIWRNIDCFDENEGSFKSWAAGIARLEVINTLCKLQEESSIRQAASGDVKISAENTKIQTGDRRIRAGDLETGISEKDISAAKLAEIQLSGEIKEILGNLEREDQELFRCIFPKEAEPGNVGDFSDTKGNKHAGIFQQKKKNCRKKKEGKKA